MTYKQLAIKIAKESGRIMRNNFKLGMQRNWKKDGSPVTATDLKINSLVIQQIKKYFPEHSIIAEEGSALKKSDYVWVCDPLDGTIPFSHGIPTSAFSLALVFKGQPILGVVYDPFMDRLFSAEKGKGAFLNNKRIHVSKIKKLNDKRTAIDMCYWKTARYNISKIAEHLIMKIGVINISGSGIIYSGMLLAAGELSVVFFPHYTPHDVATIKIIVEEAGGKATDLFGNQQRYDRKTKGLLATNGYLHKELLKIVKAKIKK
jgi:myo-inositol-1(or 4)-monophosphatase